MVERYGEIAVYRILYMQYENLKSTEIEDRRGLGMSPPWLRLFKISSLLVSNSTSIRFESYKAEKFSTAEKLDRFVMCRFSKYETRSFKENVER